MKKDWLRRCDYLNVQTSLSYRNEYFYATKIGAILTILLFFIIVGIITYQIIILCKKTSFTLISNQYTDLSQTIDFSQTPFLFEITNNYGQCFDINNKLFELEAYDMEMTIKTGENGAKIREIRNTKLEFVKCDKLFSNMSEYSELDLSRFICIKPDHNLTAYGLIGDMNNPFKGIRMYINKCKGPNCYDTNEIVKQINNVKFIVTYLSLSSNMFYLNSENIKYQLFSKYFSLSTNILKKLIFTYDIGRFYLYNDVISRKHISFDYILGNDYYMDFDLDPTSTIHSNEYTLASLSFHFGGNVVETRKEVQTLFQAISIIGNYFNIILTIFKVINNYYSNKLLFSDIFETIFFAKKNMNFNIKRNFHLNNYKNLNKNNSLNHKKNMDISEEISFNIIKRNSVRSLSKKIISTKERISKKISKTYDESKRIITKKKLNYYYLIPLWFLKRNKTFKNLYSIKERICGYFSIEKINELIKFKEIIEEKSMKSKMNNTELIYNKNNNYESNCLNGGNINIIQNLK